MTTEVTAGYLRLLKALPFPENCSSKDSLQWCIDEINALSQIYAWQTQIENLKNELQKTFKDRKKPLYKASINKGIEDLSKLIVHMRTIYMIRNKKNNLNEENVWGWIERNIGSLITLKIPPRIL